MMSMTPARADQAEADRQEVSLTAMTRFDSGRVENASVSQVMESTLVSGYEVVRQLAGTAASLICEARHTTSQSLALLKLPLPGVEPAAFRREYELLHSIAVPGVVRALALVEEGNTPTAMVLEHFPGESLEQVLDQAPLPWRDALGVASALARLLSRLHAADMIHKDLRPANCLIDRTTGEIAIVDMHVVGLGALRQPPLGDLAAWTYLAPEQTGRMRCQPDARTDLYVIGLILYRMVTGSLPFEAADALEWIHCHMARVPKPPRHVPEAVSDMAMKLLAKSPDNRYQTTAGLLYDIEQCLAGKASTGAFILGTQDVPEQLRAVQHLHGRNAELAALRDAFERVKNSGQSALALVTGEAGSGKSSLVHELHKELIAARSDFIGSKFDQHRREVPYSAFSQAFAEMIKLILSGRESQVAYWRMRLTEALGSNAEVIIQVVPSLEIVLGPQPPVPPLPPNEAEGRFRRTFQKFVGALAQADKPLLLFIDDLQWADQGSLELLKDLVNAPDIQGLLVVCACRVSESAAPDLVCRTLMQACGWRAVTHVSLKPLATADMCSLVAGALHMPPIEVVSLAEALGDRTAGNPFFTMQMLMELDHDNVLAFNPSSRRWTWDTDAIRAKAYTPNVVDLLVAKLERLPASVLKTVHLAACLGNRMPCSLLAAALGESPGDTMNDLSAAVRAGLVLLVEDTYSFTHDRVQEAAYSMIPAEERPALRLNMGRLLLAHLSGEALQQRIFDVVSALNDGAQLITDAHERAMCCDLNEKAGHKAKNVPDHAAAGVYFSHALDLLPDDPWRTVHDNCWDIHVGLAECEFMTGQLATARSLLDVLLNHARSQLEIARASRIKIAVLLRESQPGTAATVVFEVLRQSGLALPEDNEGVEAMILAVREDIRIWLQGRPLLALLDAPRTTDEGVVMTMKMLNDSFAPIYIARPALAPLIGLHVVNLSLRHGHTPESSYGYEILADTLIDRVADFEMACDLADLALQLDDSFGGTRLKSRLLYHQAFCVNHWRESFADCQSAVQRALAAALDADDLWLMGFNTMVEVLLAGEQGEPLDKCIERGKRLKDFPQLAAPKFAVSTWVQYARCLQGATQGLTSLDDGTFSEAQWRATCAANQSRQIPFIWHVLRQTLEYHAGRHAESLANAHHASEFAQGISAHPLKSKHHLFHLLAQAASFETFAPAARRNVRREFRKWLPVFEAWARQCPQNQRARWLLLRAEFARIEGRETEAPQEYEKAVQAAHENDSLHMEALACELAARWHADRGIGTAADAYLRRAHSAYLRWGAHGIVRELEVRHPRLRDAPRASVRDPDMLAIVKASQAISGEIDLDRLLDTLMRTAMEAAGAQKGLLLLAEAGSVSVAAEASVQGPHIHVMRRRDSRPGHDDLPWAVLNYVSRTHEMVWLADAAEPHAFAAEAYFQECHPRSVLCLPLLRRAALIGLLYLEHGLVSNAFTPDRAQLLSMLAAQAAISLETSRLYASVQEREARFRRLVDANIIGIRIANADGRITDANDAYLSLLGYSREDLEAGRLNTGELTPPEYLPLEVRAVGQLRTSGRYPPFEKEYVRRDGSRVPVLAGGTFLDSVQQSTVGFALDLTERRQAEAQREARRAAEMANRAKSEFLATMSHELRTPLNGILGYAQLLGIDNDGLSDLQRRGIDTIRQSGEHLLSLINDILDLSRIEAGRVEFSPVAIDLSVFLRSVADLIEVKANQKDLIFAFDAAPDLPPVVMVDERRLRQVLLNLLGNAVKFTDSGTVSLRVSSKGAENGHLLLLVEVGDTGVGIKPEDLPTIFEPFGQVGDLERREAGTGLGLTITRALVQAMGGNIHAHSEPGRGSQFSFELRLQLADSVPLTRSAQTRPARYEGRRRRILIVDDIAQNRSLLADFLSFAGFDTQDAEDGLTGVEKARTFQPDLIVMDSAMPGMSGLEATRLLRADSQFADLPIIAVSASATDEHRQTCLSAGANLYLSKPVRLDELVTGIGELLQLEWKPR